MTSLNAIQARLSKAEAIRRRPKAEAGDPSRWDWYAPSCPCGLPAGDCVEHPRARAAQRPPAAPWRTWAICAGRAFGKTRTGAEWVRDQVEHNGARRVALVAPTAADARDVMVEGESGLLAVCPPWNRPKYEPSKRRLTWPNGATATTYSAEEPDRLRGPQHSTAWIDEVSVWDRPQAFDMLRLGLRLGTDPRVCATFTPKPTALVRKILAEPTTARTGGTTFENARHLAADFIGEIVTRYEGTRLGKQELYAELLEIVEGAWFPQFSPEKHVTEAAEVIPGIPVRLAIDCGVSRWTGAVFYQVREVAPYEHRVNVFGDYIAEGLYSEANALAIKAKAAELCGGRVDLVRLDPAATARTGVGPAALGEYQRVFGPRIVNFWPQHLIIDGLDAIELLLDHAELKIHPRCTALISAFNNYRRATRAGELLNFPADGHPEEDMLDSLRGGIRDALPHGRRPQTVFNRVPVAKAMY